ncbi:toxin-antitoxin system, toxin component [Streptomyces goshikiensis]|uniref:toxin-antitoxin system, toxin component n=1 Tax=Streptomyces goshikiensis TaxID=1942 RepID=UPI00368E6563
MGTKADQKTLGRLAAAVRKGMPLSGEMVLRTICDRMAEMRGRPIDLRIRPFPAGMVASGLWINLPDKDVIVVEECTDLDHQIVILGHELGHMRAAHEGIDADGLQVAARMLDDGADLSLVTSIAARSCCDEVQEGEAETFGLLLGSYISPLLERVEYEQRLTPLEKRMATSFGL